jgi:tungstate transport system substrate-binding protein
VGNRSMRVEFACRRCAAQAGVRHCAGTWVGEGEGTAYNVSPRQSRGVTGDSCATSCAPDARWKESKEAIPEGEGSGVIDRVAQERQDLCDAFMRHSARIGRSVDMTLKHRLLIVAAILGLTVHGTAGAQDHTILVASTTSTEQSGLFGFILPRFSARTGIQVKVVAVGTGQALDIGRRGDADVVFVHDRPAEEKFIADGFGVSRFDVMYNDFIVVGPVTDPAHIAGDNDVIDAFRRIAATKAPFISRGDRSGTNEAELRYWMDAGIVVSAAQDRWYHEIGQGMGPALNVAASTSAYLLADRGTWLSFHNRRTLVILVEGDHRLFNQYGVMLVNRVKNPNVKVADGQAFVDWLVSTEGQSTIAQYKIDGQQLFFPNAEASRR